MADTVFVLPCSYVFSENERDAITLQANMRRLSQVSTISWCGDYHGLYQGTSLYKYSCPFKTGPEHFGALGQIATWGPIYVSYKYKET